MFNYKKILIFCIAIVSFTKIHSMGQTYKNKYYNSGSLNFVPDLYFTVGEYHPQAVKILRPDIWRDPEVKQLGDQLLDTIKSWVMEAEVPVYKRRLDEEITNMNSSLLADPFLTDLNSKLKNALTEVKSSPQYIKASQDLDNEIEIINKKFKVDFLKSKLKELYKKLDSTPSLLEAKKQLEIAQKNIKKTAKIDDKEKQLNDQTEVLLNRYQVKNKLAALLKEVNTTKTFGKYNSKIVTDKVIEDLKDINNKDAFQKLKIGMVDYADRQSLKDAYNEFYLAKTKFENSLKIDPYILVFNKELFNLKVSEFSNDVGVQESQKNFESVLEKEQNVLEIPKYLNLLAEAKKNVEASENVKKAKERLEVVQKDLEKTTKINEIRKNIEAKEKDIKSHYQVELRRQDLERCAGAKICKMQNGFDEAVKKAMAKNSLDF